MWRLRKSVRKTAPTYPFFVFVEWKERGTGRNNSKIGFGSEIGPYIAPLVLSLVIK